MTVVVGRIHQHRDPSRWNATPYIASNIDDGGCRCLNRLCKGGWRLNRQCQTDVSLGFNSQTLTLQIGSKAADLKCLLDIALSGPVPGERGRIHLTSHATPILVTISSFHLPVNLVVPCLRHPLCTVEPPRVSTWISAFLSEQEQDRQNRKRLCDSATPFGEMVRCRSSASSPWKTVRPWPHSCRFRSASERPGQTLSGLDASDA